MKLAFYFFLLLPALVLAQSGDDELINPKELIPNILIDLKYARNDHQFINLPQGNMKLPNFYTANECLLLKKAVLMLKKAQDSLNKIRTYKGRSFPKGISIKIWDGYRPRAVQYLFWAIFPNSTYIANPATGSKHNRGGAIDLTLTDLATMQDLEMPTLFDDFSDKAGLNYSQLPQTAIENRQLLIDIMSKVAGLNTYSAEWWHYEVPSASSYPLLDFQMK